MNQRFGFSSLLFNSKNQCFSWGNVTQYKYCTNTVVTSEITSHAHGGFQPISSPITCKAPALMLSRTAWPHLAKGETEWQSCQAQERSAAWMSVLPTAAAAAGAERLLQDPPVSRHAGFTWVNAAKKTTGRLGLCSRGGGYLERGFSVKICFMISVS